MMGNMCNKCKKITGILLLVAGIGLLLRDLAVWDFWGIQWFTAIIIVVGLTKFASSMCKDCATCCGIKMK